MEKMDIRKQLGCIKSPIEDTDYLAVPYLADVLFAGPLPTKVDFVPEMTPIKNQGNEGACVGFATTAVKEWMELKDYNLTLDKYIDLSERYIYQAAKKENGQSPTSEGTTLKAAAAALVKRGICRESFWPYVAQKIGAPVPDAATADADAAIFQIDAKYTRITTVNELKAALVKYGPLLIAVTVYKNWYRDNHTGHIPDPTWAERLSGVLGGHAICFVGYDDATGEFKFKNSWKYADGRNWGDNGYGYLTYKEVKRTFMDGFCLVDKDDPNPLPPPLPGQKRELTVKDIPLRFKLWYKFFRQI